MTDTTTTRTERRHTSGTTATCSDCAWRDEARGAHGRAAQHHDRTGHEVEVTTLLTYHRAGAPPGQRELEGLGRTYIGDPT